MCVKFWNLINYPRNSVRQQAKPSIPIIHSAVMGPISPQSYRKGYWYITVFIDEYWRLAIVYTIKAKSDTVHWVQMFVRSAWNLLGKYAKLRNLRLHQKTEYTRGHNSGVLKKLWVDLHIAFSDTPEHNGVPEGLNQTIQKKARLCMQCKFTWHLVGHCFECSCIWLQPYSSKFQQYDYFTWFFSTYKFAIQILKPNGTACKVLTSYPKWPPRTNFMVSPSTSHANMMFVDGKPQALYGTS